MPDWRNPEDYAYTERLSLHAWAWEFLRRSTAYRLAWTRFVAAEKAHLEALPTTDRSVELYEEMWIAFRAASEEFGLFQPVDPDVSIIDTDKIRWWNAVGVRVLTSWNQPGPVDRTPWPGFPGAIALAFDFTLPLEAQIEHAKDVLHRCRAILQKGGWPWKEPKVKVRIDKVRFALYLRLLDADRCGASQGEMGRRLFAKEIADKRSSVKSALETARRMTQSGYRELLLKANL